MDKLLINQENTPILLDLSKQIQKSASSSDFCWRFCFTKEKPPFNGQKYVKIR